METNENCAGYRSLAQAKMDSILSAMLSGNDFSSVASSVLFEIAMRLTYEEFTYAQKASVQILQILVQSLTGLSVDGVTPDAYIPIQEETLDTIRKMEPLVPEERREEFQKIVAPAQEKERKILTVENIKWLIMLIATFVAPLVPYYLDRGPTEYEEQSLQIQEEFLDKFQELIDLIEPQDSQLAKTDDQSKVIGHNSHDFADSVVSNKQDKDTPD